MQENLIGATKLGQSLNGISATAVRQRVYRNPETLPPFIKIKNRYFWRMSDVTSWLKSLSMGERS